MAVLEADAHWLALAQDDPQLHGVATTAELHARLALLSETLTRQDGADASCVFQQLTFDGLHPNPVFEPNRFKPDVGTDGRKITSYYRYAVKTAAVCKAAVEYACDAKPSLICPQATLLPPPSMGNVARAETTGNSRACAMGALFQGGFKAVNSGFLKREGVTHVVNTAKDLDAHFPKLKTLIAAAKADGVSFLELNWVDNHEQVICAEDLCRAVRFIHSARQGGGSVLVHCAQGRSRSATVCVAYTATLLAVDGGSKSIDGCNSGDCDNDSISRSPGGKDSSSTGSGGGGGGERGSLCGAPLVVEALLRVQAARTMAQPNANFMAQLRTLEKAGFFSGLAADLNGTRSN